MIKFIKNIFREKSEFQDRNGNVLHVDDRVTHLDYPNCVYHVGKINLSLKGFANGIEPYYMHVDHIDFTKIVKLDE